MIKKLHKIQGNIMGVSKNLRMFWLLTFNIIIINRMKKIHVNTVRVFI